VSRLPHPSLTPLLLLAAALSIGYLTFTTAHYVVHNYQVHHDETSVRADIAQLDREHGQLVALRDYLKSDEYVEEIARRILGLVRPGETLVVVSGSDGVPAASPTAQPVGTPGEAWWKEFVPPSVAVTPSP
jgi:cell division protein FtsB